MSNAILSSDGTPLREHGHYASQLRFWVTGQPRPKGSWRPITIQTKAGPRARLLPDNKRSEPWAMLVHFEAKRAAEHNAAFPTPKGTPVAVSIVFQFERPKCHYRTGKHAHELRPDAPAIPTGGPDLDKLVRNVLDAMTGIAYADDKQVSSIHTEKAYGRSAGASFNVREAVIQWEGDSGR